jgi:hypothetical protein
MRIYDQAPAPDYWDEVIRRASGVSVGEGTTPAMNRFAGLGLASVVVVLVVIVGIQLFGGTAPGGPSPSEAPSVEGSSSPAASASAGPSAVSEFFIDGRYLLFAEVRAPFRDGWAKINRFIYSADERLGISFWSTDGVWADPCSWRTTTPVPLGGPPISAVSFIEALVQQPGREPSDPMEVELGGWDATRIELSVPADLDLAECDRIPAPGPPAVEGGGGIYTAWTDATGGTDGDSNHLPGQSDIVYVVNVDRDPVIVHAWLRGDPSPEDRAELEAMLSTVRIDLSED